MVRALATAQVQSVKEINKKAKIKRFNKKITTVILVILILAICAIFVYNFFDKNRFDFSETELGVVFYSNDFSIADSLNIVKQDQNITLVYNIENKDINKLSDFSESLSLFTYLFSANNKNTTHVFNIIENKNILYCSTNYGDLYSNEDLSSEECLSLINSASTLFVLNYPNPNLKEPAIYLNAIEKNVLVTPKSLEDLSISTYLILKSMFPSMENTLKEIYKIKESLGDENSLIKPIESNRDVNTDQNLEDFNVDQNIDSNDDLNYSNTDLNIEENNVDLNTSDSNI